VPYMTPCVKMSVPRERAKEPATRPKRQIGPGVGRSVRLSGAERSGLRLTANPDHEIAISRVALYKRNDDRRSKVGHS
jgi:hypothetical protein